MKTSITLFSFIAMCLLACLPADAKGNGHGVSGELTHVDLEANSITFIKTKKPDKPVVTITLMEETAIEIHGEKARLADLKEKIGMQVFVDVNEKDKTAYSILVREKKRNEKSVKPQEDDHEKKTEAAEQAE